MSLNNTKISTESSKMSSKITKIANIMGFQSANFLLIFPQIKTIPHPESNLFDEISSNRQYLWIA